ncbi:Gp15 family bacteriophage protein [Latilactobacillus sakei]
MLTLTHRLENSFDYKGSDHSLDLSFDNVLRWYELMEDDELENVEKIEIAFEMFFNACPINGQFMLEAVDSISKFIRVNPYGNYDETDVVDTNDPIRYYSYTQDAEAIYASFLDQYNIDLIEQQGKLHWDKFKALLNGLSDSTYFKRIISIRTRPLKGLEGEELTALQEAQSFYQLDVNRSVGGQESQINDMFAALKTIAIKK